MIQILLKLFGQRKQLNYTQYINSISYNIVISLQKLDNLEFDQRNINCNNGCFKYHQFKINLYLNNICECQIGYFQGDNDLVCSKCSDMCQQCNFTKDQCTSCYPSHYRLPKNDTCICMDGYYDNGQLICQKCPSTCKTCLDAITCSSCYDSQFRIISINNKSCTLQCLLQFLFFIINYKCLPGYFENSSDVCEQCHFSCLECSKNTSSSCIV